MSHSEVENLNQNLPVPIADDELELFLRFQHETANIMYFRYYILTSIIFLYFKEILFAWTKQIQIITPMSFSFGKGVSCI